MVQRPGAGPSSSRRRRSSRRVDDGRVFTGHQGIGLKLVDEIGDERDCHRLAREREERRCEPAGARLSAAEPFRRSAVPACGAAAALLDAAGLDAIARRLDELGRRRGGRAASILTVCWPFGTLPARTERRSRRDRYRAIRAAHDQVGTRSTHFRAEPAPLSA